MIGRKRELTLLRETIGSPAVILVEGAAGVGKSALVRAMLGDPALRSTRQLIGQCHRLREPFPLGPVIEALCGVAARPPQSHLSSLVGSLRPVLPELAELLPPQPAPLDDPRAQRHRIFRALRELLSALGRVICVLEDLHWADESTLEFLAFLISDPPSELSLVGTYRGADLPSTSSLPALCAAVPAHVRHATVHVPALSVDEVGRLSCALLGTSAVTAELAQHLLDQTAGIPFVLEEVVRLRRDQLAQVDEWRTADDLDERGVPPAVRQSLRERMACLGSDACLVSRVAAVLAAPAAEELVGTVAGLPRARAIKALSTALSAAVLEERADGLYGFVHGLAAQAVYDEIPAPERRRLHRRAAEALQASSEPRPLAQLAHHHREAGQLTRWARYAEAAADAARDIGDDRSAARLLEQALDGAHPSRAARLRLALKLGTAALYSASPERAIELLQRVRDEDRVATGVRGELRYRIARLRYQTGDAGPWREEMQTAVAELHDQPALAARAMITLAWPVVGQGPVEHDLDWLDRAVEAADRADDPAVRAGVAGQRAAILSCVGDPHASAAIEQLPRHGRSVEDTMQLLQTCQSLACTATNLGHFGRAQSLLLDVARLSDELPHVSWDPWLASARASLDWGTGRWEGLEQRLRALSEQGAGGPALAIGNQMILSALLLSRGRVQDAETGFESILQRAASRGWMGSRTAAAAGLARIFLGRGDAQAAVRAARHGLEVLERKGIWIWGRDLVPVTVQALVACGQQDEASTLTQRFSAGVTGRDAPAACAAGHFCRATVAEAQGRYAEAARGFARAAQIASQLPAPYEAARATAARARCLLSAGDSQGAVLLLGALKAFEELGAGWDGSHTRAELRTHEIRLPSQRRGGRRSYGDNLSPREEEVAQLASMGRKNREIAQTLFISRRTVETHVASALRKLGARSRESLGEAMAARTGEPSFAARMP